MKVLVSGSAGLIGSNLCRSLLIDGHDVVGVDNYWRGRRVSTLELERNFPGQFHFIEFDLTQPNFPEGLFEGVDHVFHLADVVAGINFVFANELQVWQDNLRINSNMIAQIIRNGVRRATYVGTACSYPKQLTTGGGDHVALTEDKVFPADPESAYGWSKLMGEYEFELAQKEGLIDVAILRLHNVYGAPAELDPDRSQVIPALARKAVLFPTEAFVVWGSGKQRRSFVHVDDVTTALMITLESGLGAGAIQIGPAASTSIRDIAETIVSVSGKDIAIAFDESRPEGDGDRVADISRAREILGWRPTISLQKGLSDFYEWVQQEFRLAGTVS